MMKLKHLLFTVLVLLIMGGQAGATTHTCTSDGELDTAIAALANDDTIIIAGSWTSDAEYEIANTGVTIYGSSTSNTITLGVDVAYCFELKNDGCTIRDFTLEGDRGNRTTGTGIGLANSSDNHTVSGMIIKNFEAAGIICAANADGQTITNCTVQTCNSSVAGAGQAQIWFNSSDNGTVTNCVLTGDTSGKYGIFAQTSTGGTIQTCTFTSTGKDAITLYGGCDNWTINDNTITDWATTAASDAIRCDGANCVISNNTIRQNTDTGNLAWAFESVGNAGDADGTIYQNNDVGGAHLDRVLEVSDNDIIFRRNKCACPNPTGITNVAVVRGLNSDGPQFYDNEWNVTVASGEYCFYLNSNAVGARAITIYNETIYNSANDGTGIRYEETTGTWTTSNLKNMIIHGFAKGVVAEDKDDNGVAIVHTHNDYYSNTKNIQKDVGGVFTDITLGTGEITTDPLFVNTANGDFHLQIDSPCIDAGLDVGQVSDLDGWPMLGLAWNIGAYEERIYYPQYVPKGLNISSIGKGPIGMGGRDRCRQ